MCHAQCNISDHELIPQSTIAQYCSAETLFSETALIHFIVTADGCDDVLSASKHPTVVLYNEAFHTFYF